MDSTTTLVTGAAGYIGSRVTANLLEDGHEVIPIDNFYSAQVDRFNGVEILDVDVRNRERLREVFDGVDAVMHLAAISGVEDCRNEPTTAFDVNVGGTENVAWLCQEYKTPLVFPASMAVIGDPVEFPITSEHPRKPLNLYGLTKTMSEEDVKWLAKDSFPAHIYVKSNLYGNHYVGEKVTKRTVINIFVDKALKHEPLTVHKPGTQARDFIHVKDVAEAYTKSLKELLDTDRTGAETFPIASGECMSILEIAETVQEIMEEEHGYRPEIELIENPRGSETEASDFEVDTSEAINEIGFSAEHSIRMTVREMIK